jgi:2-keto-4-pentenoate hydratase/2-oxohepta-3-ene-1,7-dioic acid hydratase in catechol pathway
MHVNLPIYGSDQIYRLQPQKIIALGMNYRAHVAEAASLKVKSINTDVPDEPILFAKTPNVLIANGDPIIIPAALHKYEFDLIRADYEAELAFIINRKAKHIKQSEALDYILGFTCMNDVSERNLQSQDKSGWFRGKSLDTFGPIGPQLVYTEDIGDAQNLNIECRLNGKIVQQSNTGNMIFSIPEMIEFITRWITLEEGDVVSTGTPAGVGPLQDGDVVEVEIEKIGILSNPVQNEVID